MDVVKQAEAFELKPLTFKTTSERIEASREVKGHFIPIANITLCLLLEKHIFPTSHLEK